MLDLSTHFWKSWEKFVLRGWRHPSDDDDGGLGHMCPKGWETCVPTPKKGQFSFWKGITLKNNKKIISVLNFTEKKHMKREQSVVLIQHHLIIISVSILRANGSLCDTWYQFAGGVVTVFDHFVVVCNTGRLCDEDSGEATALTRIIHPIHFIQPSRD